MKFDIALARGSAEAASPLIGLCYNRAHQLEGRFVTEAYELDGCTAILKVRGDSSVAIISCGDSGVVLHPRTGAVELLSYTEYLNQFGLNVPVPRKTIWGVKGGWLNGTTNYDTANIYPIDDGDNASFGLGVEDEDAEEKVLVGEFLQDEGNYGNLYWWNGNLEEPDFLSWKGTPTRHFRVPNNIDIPGISIQETATPSLMGEDVPIFTTFSHYVYNGGVVLETAPAYNWPYSGPSLAYVLGAARDSEGTIYIVTQSDRHNVPLYIAAFSDGTVIQNDTGQGVDRQGVTRTFYKQYSQKKGIYTQLWKQGTQFQGWDLVWEEETGRIGLPWFADKDCTEFVRGDGATLTIGGLYQAKASVTGTLQTSGDMNDICSSLAFAHSFTDYLFHEHSVKTLVSLATSLRSNHTFTNPRTKVYRGSFKHIYHPDIEANKPKPLQWALTITSTHLATVGQIFSSGVSGGQGELIVSYQGFTVVNGIVTSVSGCAGGGGAMGSETVTDECGASITRPIRLQGGFWRRTSEWYSSKIGTGLCNGDYTYEMQEDVGSRANYIWSIGTSLGTYIYSAYQCISDWPNCVTGQTVTDCAPPSEYETIRAAGSFTQSQVVPKNYCPSSCGAGTYEYQNVTCARYQALCMVEYDTWTCP